MEDFINNFVISLLVELLMKVIFFKSAGRKEKRKISSSRLDLEMSATNQILKESYLKNTVTSRFMK